MKNKSTILIIILLAILAVSIFALKNKKNIVETPDVVSSAIPTTGKYCFARNQKAITEAPYSVEEHIVLNFDGVAVSGTKSGTQSGPDMTNGYEGTLDGATIANEKEMELTYAYTIEGSKNRELEVYTFSGKDLVKKRWALKEQTLNYANTLVPDYVGEPTLIIYTNEPCATPFDKTVSVNVGEKVTFADGLTLKLQKINDSRCKPDVQCIWQGELSAVFVATFPDASSSEITIGTVMKKSVTSKGYNFTLQSATEKSVSMRVSH